MGLESSLWEASRPAFRVRYIHDPGGPLQVPLYASYGIANGQTARAKLARIVRRAPEVVIKVTGRQRGGAHVKAHLEYIGRKGEVGIESRDGEILTTKDDINERAAEWSDSLEWRERPTVSSVSVVFSMPEGTDPDKVLSAVRALAHGELSDNHDYVLALHTDTPRPHVHLTVQAEGLDRTRFNPRPVQLNRFRERFARELRARGIAAEATPRRARGQGIAGSSMALVKLRARLRTEGSHRITNSDLRTNEQAMAVVHGEEALPPFVAAGGARWQDIRSAYEQAAEVLEATGQADDLELASDVRSFLGKHQSMNATPEIFAEHHRAMLQREAEMNAKMSEKKPKPRTPDKGRSR
jgi:type IV secretion system T-DNA border endonuclease VirD2